MRIGKRIFPYPIIHNSSPSHSFYESYFSFYYKIESQENLFIIKDIYYKLENTYINRLINENKVKVVCIVECSHTVFRKKYEIYKEPKNIEIPIHFLNDKVEISAYAYATQNIDNYRHCDFIYEYTGYNFQIEKYDILAADDGFTVKVNYEETKDKSVSSIFLIIKNMTENEGLMRIELSRNKIKILLPEKQFNLYDRMRKQPIFKNFYFCIFVSRH